MTPEGIVKREIKTLFKKHNTPYIMPATWGMGTSGAPDFFACHRGRTLLVEAKATPKNKPTALQMKRITEFTEAGAVCFVIHCDNLNLLSEYLTCQS